MRGNALSGCTWTKVAYRVLLAAGIALGSGWSGNAQVGSCSSTTALRLRHLGAHQLDSSGTQFETGGTRLLLSCKSKDLAAIEVKISKLGSKTEYDRVVGMIDNVKTLGAFREERPFGTIEPSGWISRAIEFSKAYIVRKEQVCEAGKSSCGIKSLTVFYWLPLRGRVDAKRTEKFEIKGFDKRVRYYLSVAGRQIEVSETDYRQLRKGQYIRLEMTLGNDLARIDP